MANDRIIELDWWEEATFQPSEIYEDSESSSTSSSPPTAAAAGDKNDQKDELEEDDKSDDIDELGSIRISCVPAQHGSARTGWDKCSSLWCGFVVEQFACKPSEAPSRTTVYFAG